MIPEIDSLIHKLRKEVYAELQKKQEIKPKVYFFVAGKNGPSEIIIPGAEWFFRSGDTKNMLPGYIRVKWEEYRVKVKQPLLAVMIMSDIWWVVRPIQDMNQEQIEEVATNTLPRNQPDRKQAISFMVYDKTEGKNYMFEYIREGKHLHWGEIMEDIKLADWGRFAYIFPKDIADPSP
jgi:hypothetical protein